MPTAVVHPQELFRDALSVSAEINYLDRSVKKPYRWVTPADAPEGEPVTNQVSHPVEVSITDLKGIGSSELGRVGFTTKEAGFQLVDGFGLQETSKDWAAEKWSDDEWIKEKYYQDVDRLLKKELGVDRTFIFDHTVRKRREKQDEDKPDDPSNRLPVAYAHSDQSRKAGEARVLKHLGQDVYDRVKRGELHAQLINVWRPLRGPVKDTPLAVADSRTVSPGGEDKEPDWRESELRYKDWSGETLMIHHSPSHRWYYHSDFPTSKAILLKCYDSETETRTPHTAFVDPTSPEDAPKRWSVEVRVLTITGKNA